MTERQVYRIMQITTKSKTNYQFGCSNFEEFKIRRKAILENDGSFIDIVDTCTILKSEIESIEYFEKEVIEDE